MAKPNNKKFVWLIKNFSSLPPDNLYSAPVLISDVKWRLSAYPNKTDSLAVYVTVGDDQSLPFGWRRYAKFHLTIANNHKDKLSIRRETHSWYDQNSPSWGFSNMLPRTKLLDKDGGFLVDDELTIVAEIEVIDTLDEEASEPLKKIKQVDDGVESKDSSEKESVDVNGFQVHPSQVESVRRIFEEHPDIAVGFHAKNQYLRTAYMNFLLSLMETLRQPLEELSNEDLEEADIALGYLKDASFKVDWLDTKLEQVKDKKETEQA